MVKSGEKVADLSVKFPYGQSPVAQFPEDISPTGSSEQFPEGQFLEQTIS